MQISLCLTAFNEALNLTGTIKDLDLVVREFPQLRLDAIIVDNGSTDNSSQVLQSLAIDRPWLQIVTQAINENYGGGLLRAVDASSSEYCVFLSADRQYAPADIISCIASWHSELGRSSNQRVFITGRRVARFDGFSARFVSASYTTFCNIIVGTKSSDVNAQPKIMPRDFILEYRSILMNTFVIDAQLLALAQRDKLRVISVPVTFLNRREGVSSWQGRRIRTYADSARRVVGFRQKLRQLKRLQ